MNHSPHDGLLASLREYLGDRALDLAGIMSPSKIFSSSDLTGGYNE